MIDQNKHQCWQHPNELLITTNANSMTKKKLITSVKEI